MMSQDTVPGLFWFSLRRHWRWVLGVTAGLGLCLTVLLDGQSTHKASLTKSYLVSSVPGESGVDDAVVSANTDRAARDYAAVLRKDDGLLLVLGARLGRSADSLRTHITAGYEPGSSTILVRYEANSAAQVRSFFRELDRVVVTNGLVTSNLPPGLVRPLQTDNAVLERVDYLGLHPASGLLGGLLAALLLAVVLERTRPRVVNRAHVQSLTDRPVLELRQGSQVMLDALAVRALRAAHLERVVILPTALEGAATAVALAEDLKVAAERLAVQQALDASAASTPIGSITDRDADRLARGCSHGTVWMLLVRRHEALRRVETALARLNEVEQVIVVLADAWQPNAVTGVPPELVGAAP